MQVNFWLLDINYEVKNHEPEIWLWGIEDSGKRVLIIDRGFESYFYAVLKEGVNPSKIVEFIENRIEAFPFISKIEPLERKLFGKPVKALRIHCKDPEMISKYARSIEKIDGVKECLEDDIRYSMRYMIDKEVVPCGWHTVEAKIAEVDERPDVQVDEVYVALSSPIFVEKKETPNLRILGFSIIC
ncbi:DNA polymerase II, partial [Candidatus Bathyarchaeota archaeon]|nr:DNA polymerase II [Candidatus Bathyarchaeota archaeon]